MIGNKYSVGLASNLGKEETGLVVLDGMSCLVPGVRQSNAGIGSLTTKWVARARDRWKPLLRADLSGR